MTNAARQNKQMPDCMIERKSIPRIKDGAERIGQAATNQQS